MEGFESFVGVDFWTALFTLINMILTFALLRKFLFKPVKKMIDDRQAEIDGLYADAASSKKEAEAMKAEYQSQLADANAQRDAILRDAAAKAQRREEDVLAAANREADAIREKARADIEGAYTMINQQFEQHALLGKYKYVNREDDVGAEGLRKAKLSYHPAFMVDKGYVTEK